MNVGIVTLRYQAPGGVESTIDATARGLVAAGDRVTVYASDLYDEGRWERRSEWPAPPSGVSVQRFPVMKRLIPRLTMPMMVGLIDALASGGHDVIHAHSHRYGHVLEAAAVAAATSTPLVVSTHYHPADRREPLRNRLLLRGQDHLFGLTAYDTARRIIVETELEASLVSEFAPRTRIRVVPPGIDLAEWRRDPPGDPAGLPGLPPRFLLYAGRIAPNKGLPFLLESLARVPRADRLPLVLVGADWGERPALERMGERLGVAQDLVWLGHLEDRRVYRAVFRHASAFVLPSEWEAFGLVLLEAMAAGIPIVATAVGGVPELLEAGKDGFLVEYGDVDALTERLRSLRAGADPNAERIASARRRVEGLGWDRSVAALREVYREAVAGRGAIAS